MYELFFCIGISVMGCGAVRAVPVETKQECLELLAAARFQNKGSLATGEDTTDSLAYCRPAKENQSEKP